MTATFRLCVLGSGTVAPTLLRYPAGYVLETPSQLTLLGCNGMTISRLLGFGFNYTKVSTICISHQHNDHSSGLCHFIQAVEAMHTQQKREMSPIQIMGPVGIANNLTRDLRLHWPELNSADYAQVFDAVEGPQGQISPHHSVSLHITAFSVNHSDRIPSLGFRIEYEGFVLIYPGDFGSRQNMNCLLPHLQGADLLILHCGAEEPDPYHLTVNQALEIRKHASPKKLLISHIPQYQLRQVQEQVSHLPDVEVAADSTCHDLIA